MRGRKAKQHSLWLTSSRELIISFRRFRTEKDKRSKAFKQFVIPFVLLPIKEISISHHKRRYKHKFSSKISFPKFGLPKFKLPHLSKAKTVLPYIMAVIGIGGALYFGLNVKKVPAVQPATQFSIKTPVPKEPVGLPRSEPTHITIPAVGINTDIIDVGRKADGTMEVPDNPHVTGWYKYSPTPGEVGPAVIVGHVDNWYIGPAVFWRLRELKAGDEVQVTRSNGQVVTFKVTGLEQYSQESFPSDKVYGNIDYPGLRLITCGGTFNTATGHYDQNTVVYASIVANGS